jgi:hypothetical protein
MFFNYTLILCDVACLAYILTNPDNSDTQLATY